MSNKTYPLGSSEAMKHEPRLDEEYYLPEIKKKILEDEHLDDSLEENFYFNQLIEEIRR